MPARPATGDEQVRLHRLIHRGNPGDVAFYVGACDGARSVLELGCGDGRIAAALARAGLDVTGLDSHPGMLAAAGEACAGLAVALVEADMRELELGRRFDRVLIPYNGLYCLPDDDAVVACLGSARDHLEPDGALLFDAYIAGDDEDAGDGDTGDDGQPAWLVAVDDGPDHIEVYERSVLDAARRDLAVTYVHLIEREGDVDAVAYTIDHHYLAPDAVPALLAAAGLALDAIWGGFDRRELGAASEHMVVRATRR